MNETLKRILTGTISGILFFGCFFYSANLCTIILLAVLIYILIFEWPKIINPKSLNFWLITPLYPILPTICLIYLTKHFYSSNKLIALYPFLIAWTADTAGYFVGKFLGKHKICPQISPKKTFEGLLGSFAFVTIVNLFLLHKNLYQTVSISILLTLVAFGGDIFESFLKRKAGVKDTGSILPGHGGLLDRFDSVYFVAIILLLFFLFVS
ncbi:TPA: hypothetical protein DEO28_05170 [Candidatus Dependentiae bacterium]|nr:MAG: Phosphatidate cytidylyltransferase [candidate division TM6 bacterium GW2011_GWE2_31_21]KKP53944.1 MAG: Phosphatidate cytidylyltransferase [candidate division TM6 bacterium GW2011_GWF2_33_332]HBS47724.1 hypothetical protein [Candidatus Dependentiae bacterium]HBZ73873.1 hypothetical protein [Candidatus Dependentiae bacterium]